MSFLLGLPGGGPPSFPERVVGSKPRRGQEPVASDITPYSRRKPCALAVTATRLALIGSRRSIADGGGNRLAGRRPRFDSRGAARAGDGADGDGRGVDASGGAERGRGEGAGAAGVRCMRTGEGALRQVPWGALGGEEARPGGRGRP